MKIVSTIVIVIALLGLPGVASAQPDNPPGPPVIPIDGGLGVALAAGAAYGISRLRKSNSEVED